MSQGRSQRSWNNGNQMQNGQNITPFQFPEACKLLIEQNRCVLCTANGHFARNCFLYPNERSGTEKCPDCNGFHVSQCRKAAYLQKIAQQAMGTMDYPGPSRAEVRGNPAGAFNGWRNNGGRPGNFRFRGFGNFNNNQSNSSRGSRGGFQNGFRRNFQPDLAGSFLPVQQDGGNGQQAMKGVLGNNGVQTIPPGALMNAQNVKNGKKWNKDKKQKPKAQQNNGGQEQTVPTQEN